MVVLRRHISQFLPELPNASKRTPDDLPPLEEGRLFQSDSLHETTEEDRQAEHDRREAPGEIRHPQHWGITENILALDMHELLDLCQTSNLRERRLVESRVQCRGVGAFDGHRQIGKRGGYLVAEEDGQAAEMTVVFGFDADLEMLIFVQNSFGSIGEPFQPLHIVRRMSTERD